MLSQFQVKNNSSSKNKPTQNPHLTPLHNSNFPQVPALEAALLKQKVPLKYINGIHGILISIQKQLSINPVKHWALCLQLLLPKLYTIDIILRSFPKFYAVQFLKYIHN